VATSGKTIISEPSLFARSIADKILATLPSTVAVRRVDLSDCDFHKDKFTTETHREMKNKKLKNSVAFFTQSLCVSVSLPLLLLFYHFKPVAAFVVAHFVHYVMDYKHAATGSFKEVFRIGRVGNFRDVKAFAFVFDSKTRFFRGNFRVIRTSFVASNLLPCLTALTNASSRAIKRLESLELTMPIFSMRFIR
jgi:hypothetical protein